MESQASYRTLQPGEMLNWYRIERILGRGGFGVIYLATDTNLDIHVAIKEYIPSDVATRSGDSHVHPITEDHGDVFRWGMDRFIKEARNLVKFKHPNIVRVMSVFQENNTAYMVMEFEEGEDLRSHLRKPGANSERSLKQLILPISKGLAEVHRHGFIHRDIKPANILVRKDGSPVLLDFGSARNASKFTQQSLTALVSVGYAPLEQYNQESEEQQGPWTDIYALGGTLYFAIGGKDPVESTRRGAAVLNGGKDPLISAEYLGEGKYSVGFLRAIDWAMQFGIADRPQTLNDWIPALLADNLDPDTGFPSGPGGPTSRIAAVRPGVDTKVMHELSDATVLSRERRTNIGGANQRKETQASHNETGANLKGLAGLTLLLSLVALGLWFITSEPEVDRAVDANSTPPAAQDAVTPETAEQIAQRNAELAKQQEAERKRTEQEQERQREAAALKAEQNRLAQAAAEEARLQEQAQQAAAEALAATNAAKAAEADEKQAEKQAEEEAQAEELAKKAEEEKRAEALAAQRIEQQRLARLAERQAAARTERRLKQAIGAAQTSLSVGDLTASQQQLKNAQAIDADDARVQTLAFAVQSALDEHNKPVSDADFDKVTRMFDALRRAIENKDTVALDRLAVSSQQSTIFKSLMNNFERIDVSITGIRVRNADKSIAGTLRIDSMIRANGDRGTLSEQYISRTITSRRVSGGWSKIEW